MMDDGRWMMEDGRWKMGIALGQGIQGGKCNHEIWIAGTVPVI